MIQKLYRCECFTCGLLLTEDEDSGGVYMSFWKYGSPNPMGLLERLRRAWNIVKTGRYFDDQIILNEATARELCNDMDSILKKQEVKP